MHTSSSIADSPCDMTLMTSTVNLPTTPHPLPRHRQVTSLDDEPRLDLAGEGRAGRSHLLAGALVGNVSTLYHRSADGARGTSVFWKRFRKARK